MSFRRLVILQSERNIELTFLHQQHLNTHVSSASPSLIYTYKEISQSEYEASYPRGSCYPYSHGRSEPILATLTKIATVEYYLEGEKKRRYFPVNSVAVLVGKEVAGRCGVRRCGL